MARYLTAAEFLTMFDSRRVAQMCSDNGQEAAVATLSSNPILLTAINQSSAMIDTALQVGGIYSRATIEDIISSAGSITDDTPAAKRAAPLKHLCASLTWGRLISRRGYSEKQLYSMAPEYTQAMQFLDQLQNGHAVLDIEENISAGVPLQIKMGTRLPNDPFVHNRLFGTWTQPNNGSWFDGGYL